MRDKVLVYAIAISIAAHLVVVAVVGKTFAARLNAAPAVAAVPKHIEVDLVRDPSEALKPKPVVPPPAPKYIPPPAPVQQDRNNYQPAPPAAYTPRNIRQMPGSMRNNSSRNAYHLPGNPGGQINTGTPSAHGDLTGMGTGTTRVGTVPNTVHGNGSGSGTGEGVASHPDPIPNAHEGPGRDAAPVTPPPRKTVSVRICELSNMVAGDHCKRTETKTYFDGEEPRRTCDRCKPPEPKYESVVAVKSDPVLINSSYREPAIPSSVDEGLSASVTVSYTVTDNGAVTDVEVTRSSGNRDIDRAVMKATSGMRYKPAMQAGVARSVKMTRTYHIRT